MIINKITFKKYQSKMNKLMEIGADNNENKEIMIPY